MSTPILSMDDVKKLTAQFSRDKLGVKIQSVTRDKKKAMLVLYLQHTDVMDRLEEVDPAWKSEVISETRLGETVYVRSRMTLKEVSRENVGEGGDPKSAYSDALKRCAMLFGVGRYLYDSIPVWVNYDENDRYKVWTIEEYEQKAPKSPTPAPAQNAAEKKPSIAPVKALHEPKVGTGKLATPNQVSFINGGLLRMTGWSETQVIQYIKAQFGVSSVSHLPIEQATPLIETMKAKDFGAAMLEVQGVDSKPAEFGMLDFEDDVR